MTCRRYAVTLVELMVVLAILAVLIGLILPAVQKVRAAATRIECSNNLHQIGVAAHLHHDVWKQFPAGMSYDKGNSPYLFSSWRVHLLPYLEKDGLWKLSQAAYRQTRYPFTNPPHVALAMPVSVFSCPADGRATTVQVAQQDKRDVAVTNYLGVSGQDSLTQDGIFFRDSHVRIADIRHGTAQTLFVGERPPSSDFQYGWWYAGSGQTLTGSGDAYLGAQERNLLPVTVGSCPPGRYKFASGSDSNLCDMFHFWSHHSGGAHFLFADGSVHFLSYSAAGQLPALASRSGNEAGSFFD